MLLAEPVCAAPALDKITVVVGRSLRICPRAVWLRVQDGGADGWAPMNAGWIRRDGTFGSLDPARSRMRTFRSPKTGWSTHMQVELVDEHGRAMKSEGFTVSTMSEAGYGVNQLMRWDIDGGVMAGRNA